MSTPNDSTLPETNQPRLPPVIKAVDFRQRFIAVLKMLALKSLVIGCGFLAWLLPASIYGVIEPGTPRPTFIYDEAAYLFDFLMVCAGSMAGWRRHSTLGILLQLIIGIWLGQCVTHYTSPGYPTYEHTWISLLIWTIAAVPAAWFAREVHDQLILDRSIKASTADSSVTAITT